MVNEYQKLLDQWNSLGGKKQLPSETLLPDPNAYDTPMEQQLPDQTSNLGNSNNYEDLLNNWNSLLGTNSAPALPDPNNPQIPELEQQPIENPPTIGLQNPESFPIIEKDLASDSTQSLVQEPTKQSEYERLMGEYEKYLTDSDAQLKAAQEQKSSSDMITNVINALGHASTGLANRGGTGRYEHKDIDFQNKDLVNNVSQSIGLMGKKFDKIDDFTKLGREADLHNPNSEQSVAARKMIEANFPDLKTQYGAGWEKMTAASFDDIFKVLSLKENTDARKEAAISLSGERALAKKEKDNEKLELLKTPYGIARTNDDAKKLKEAAQNKDDFDTLLSEAIALREKHGGGQVLNRDDQKIADGLSADLLAKYKSLIKLGVLSATDYKLLDSIVPKDVLGYNNPVAAIQGQDPILAQLQALKGRVDTQFQYSIPLRIREGVQTDVFEKEPKESEKSAISQEDKEAIDWANKNPKDPRAKQILQLHGM